FESQASPSPSLSLSAWRSVPGMIGALAITGQLSTASVTPSASASSFFVWQPPSLMSPVRWQVSWLMFTQVHCAVDVVQTVLTFSAQTPLSGHWALVVQIVVLVLVHVPEASVEERALTQ